MTDSLNAKPDNEVGKLLGIGDTPNKPVPLIGVKA